MLRMRIACVILLGLGLSLRAIGSEASPSDVVPGAVRAPKIGDTLDQVFANMGRPTSEMTGSSSRLLFYPNMRIKLENDVVVEITPVAQHVTLPAAGESKPAAGSQAARAGAPRKMSRTRDSVENEIQQFEQDVAAKFEAGRFAELEEQANRLNAEKPMFGDGTWKIFRFVQAIHLENHDPEEKWKAQEAKIESWEKAFPDSVTARAVHVGFLRAYAWLARGTNFAGEVDPNAWPIFESRLAEGYIVYQAAVKLKEKSPMLWYEAAPIARGQGWSLEDMMAHFEEARKAEPHFWHYDPEVAVFLLPRWYGRPGDWERFVEDVSERKDGLGAEEYALTVWEMMNYFKKNIFAETDIKWPRVKEGFIALMNEYPRSKLLLNEYAYMAVQGSDPAAARGAFEAMNGEADADLWDEKSLMDFQQWAYSSP
jgi:hypothetical protein